MLPLGFPFLFSMSVNEVRTLTDNKELWNSVNLVYHSGNGHSVVSHPNI